MSESQNHDEEHDASEAVRSSVPAHLKLTPYEQQACLNWDRHLLEQQMVPPGVETFRQSAIPYPEHMDILTWAGNGESWRAKRVLANGADVNRSDNRGVTPLHYAVSNGTAAVVKVLMQCGANPLALDPSGQTPIEMGADFLERPKLGLSSTDQRR